MPDKDQNAHMASPLRRMWHQSCNMYGKPMGGELAAGAKGPPSGSTLVQPSSAAKSIPSLRLPPANTPWALYIWRPPGPSSWDVSVGRRTHISALCGASRTARVGATANQIKRLSSDTGNSAQQRGMECASGLEPMACPRKPQPPDEIHTLQRWGRQQIDKCDQQRVSCMRRPYLTSAPPVDTHK